MTSNIVLPPLSKWAQQHLTTIYQAVKSEDVDSAFDAFISQDVKITLNGKSITRDQYKQSIKGEKFAEASAQVNFVGTVEVPDDEDQPVLAGKVGTFFQATIEERFLVLGAPQTSAITSSLNLVVVQDPSLHPPHLPGRGGAFDGRRVTQLDQVVLDKPGTIHIPLPAPGTNA